MHPYKTGNYQNSHGLLYWCKTKKMRYQRFHYHNECLGTIRGLASDIGMTPINIVETDIIRIVRFPASDGSILITCSKLDNKMTVTRNHN